MRKAFLCLIASFLLLAKGNCRVANEEFIIGELANDGYVPHSQFVEESVDAISKAFEDKYEVNVVKLNAKDLEEAIKRRSVQLVFAPAPFYRQMVEEGARDIASALPTEYSDNANSSSGSLFLVRSDDVPPIENLTQLRRKTAVSSPAFEDEGLKALNAALIQKGIDRPSSFLKSTESLPPDTAEILETLKKGGADVAVLPVCALEEHSTKTGADTSWLEVLEQRQDPFLRCLHSTPLYPGLTAFSLPVLGSEDAKIVSAALFQMAPQSGFKWDVATDYGNADKLIRALDQDSRNPWHLLSLKKIWNDYWIWIVAFISALGALILHSISTEITVRKRTVDLQKSLLTQKKLHEEAQVANQRFERLQKISTVGQMSGILAHELRQPLNAILCFAHGVRKYAEQPNSQESIKAGLHEIEEQAERASSIVEKVRNYARSKASRRKVQDWSSIVESAITNFQKSHGSSLKCVWEKKRGIFIEADELEMELVIYNILKNAAQAQKDAKHPWIKLDLKGADSSGFATLTVQDGGKPIDDKELKRISEIGNSTKPEGLGLGLPIIKSLVEAHSGHVKFFNHTNGGLGIQIRIPTTTAGGQSA